MKTLSKHHLKHNLRHAGTVVRWVIFSLISGVVVGCVGVAFGCLFGNIIGFSSSLCAVIGMTGAFCGVTNCPITSLLISFELFEADAMPYFLLSVAFRYMLSGYVGLYHSKKIVYSKYKKNYINKKTE